MKRWIWRVVVVVFIVWMLASCAHFIGAWH